MAMAAAMAMVMALAVAVATAVATEEVVEIAMVVVVTVTVEGAMATAVAVAAEGMRKGHDCCHCRFPLSLLLVVVTCDDSAFLFGRLSSKEITFARHLYHLAAETIVVKNCNISHAGTDSDFEVFDPSRI